MTPHEEERLRARYRKLVGRALFDLGQAADAARALKMPTGVLVGVMESLRRLIGEKAIRRRD